ncbi:hypothetical protein ACE01N_19525 [Saccharicrinis sp. FJH2]|uniref:hypothetical protein n=1 Tax=Saccharicrinis sp. FJH65 TaxID=3344659 RepID=UPI0035F29520
MEIELSDILKIGIPLISGGAVGAIIKALIDKRNNRIQTIKKSVEISTIFSPEKILDDYLTKITLSGTTSVYHFDSLYIAKISIINSGNKDYPDFSFGITTPDNVEIVNIETNGEDRHHNINYTPDIDFSNKSNIVDFSLTPFNRKNSYNIELLLTSVESVKNIDLNFSTDLPVKIIEATTVSVTTGEILGAFVKAALSGTAELKIR